MLSDILPLIQLSVSPAILISGVSLFLLVLTNRLGRVVDRGRNLRHELAQLNREHGEPADLLDVEQQIQVLSRRARMLKYAIILSTGCTFFAATLILAIFGFLLFEQEASEIPVSIFYTLSLLSLIGGKVAFVGDTLISLQAFDLEMERNRRVFQESPR
jgi:hypothetical protein